MNFFNKRRRQTLRSGKCLLDWYGQALGVPQGDNYEIVDLTETDSDEEGDTQNYARTGAGISAGTRTGEGKDAGGGDRAGICAAKGAGVVEGSGIGAGAGRSTREEEAGTGGAAGDICAAKGAGAVEGSGEGAGTNAGISTREGAGTGGVAGDRAGIYTANGAGTVEGLGIDAGISTRDGTGGAAGEVTGAGMLIEDMASKANPNQRTSNEDTNTSTEDTHNDGSPNKATSQEGTSTKKPVQAKKRKINSPQDSPKVKKSKNSNSVDNNDDNNHYDVDKLCKMITALLNKQNNKRGAVKIPNLKKGTAKTSNAGENVSKPNSKLLQDLINQQSDEIHAEYALLWDYILKKGIDKNKTKFYAVPSNCQLLEAPTLDKEVKEMLSWKKIKDDKLYEKMQSQLGLGVIAIGKALSLLISDDDNDEAVPRETVKTAIDFIDNGCRILTSLHFSLTMIRRTVLSRTEKLANVWNDIKDLERDKTLFGKQLGKKLTQSFKRNTLK